MKSADGPLGGSVIPLYFPAPGHIIGVFVASSHSGCRQKDRKLALVAFTNWTWSNSSEDTIARARVHRWVEGGGSTWHVSACLSLHARACFVYIC